MKQPFKFALACAALAIGLAASPVHASNNDVVRDTNGNKVKVQSGDCLRTMWLNDHDACGAEAVAAAPAKVVRDTKSVFFAFGKSTLTAEAKKTLDGLAADVKAKGAEVTGVRVAGFADQIGDAAKNEKLSKKRADAVRKYLVSKGVVAAQVVDTRWFGSSVPSTKCPKHMSQAKKIKCLQPDRRVDVEIDLQAPAAK